MSDLTDGQLAALLLSRCNISINEVLSFIAARDEVRGMCLSPVLEPALPRKGDTIRSPLAYVVEVPQ